MRLKAASNKKCSVIVQKLHFVAGENLNVDISRCSTGIIALKGMQRAVGKKMPCGILMCPGEKVEPCHHTMSKIMLL